ncbi:MAG: DUF3040 domain-containing protein [Trebonia sp.]
MPLSEHEQRQLEQIEQALYREDRRLVRLVRSSDPRVHYRRRVVEAASGFAVGAGMVAAGVVLPLIYLSIAGFVVMLLCGIWALAVWRHMSSASAPAGRRGGERRSGGRGRRKAHRTGKVGMMERFDERWRRRQEGGR